MNYDGNNSPRGLKPGTRGFLVGADHSPGVI